MSVVTHKGIPIPLKNEFPLPGRKAPDARLVKVGMQEIRISELQSPVKVLLCMPSLDTSTCALETRTFNQRMSSLADVQTLVITKDLPFAMKRFCETEGITNVAAASDFRYNEFAEQYGVELTDGTLKGLHARAVFVLDKDNVIRYSELVPDISSEPDYNAVMEAVQSLL